MRGAAGPLEWLTFPDAEDDTRQFRVNVSFLLSTYRCIFGMGCPGLLNRPPQSDLGCCERGVTFDDDEDFEHVAEMTSRLTAADCDNVAHVHGRGWYVTSKRGRPYKTRQLGGRCIFANREDGPAGKAGCAFHHLAERTGRHPADTKPSICWSVPFNFSAEDPEEPGGRETTIISAFTADAWGGTNDDEEPDGRGHMGWWCIDTPDAYRGTSPVYVTMEYELRKRMGDASYECMVKLLRDLAPRHPMPGQRVNGGRPMLPLLVEQRR